MEGRETASLFINHTVFKDEPLQAQPPADNEIEGIP